MNAEDVERLRKKMRDAGITYLQFSDEDPVVRTEKVRTKFVNWGEAVIMGSVPDARSVLIFAQCRADAARILLQIKQRCNCISWKTSNQEYLESVDGFSVLSVSKSEKLRGTGADVFLVATHGLKNDLKIFTDVIFPMMMKRPRPQVIVCDTVRKIQDEN